MTHDANRDYTYIVDADGERIECDVWGSFIELVSGYGTETLDRAGLSEYDVQAEIIDFVKFSYGISSAYIVCRMPLVEMR